jgi:hypothetical protein
MKNEARSIRIETRRQMARWGWIALFCAVALPLRASTIVGDPVDWDANPPSSAWTSGGTATLTETTGSGNPTDWLKIDFAGTGADTAQGSAADLFVGTWQSEYWIEFDFWAGDQSPSALQVRWADNEGEGRVWRNTITPGGVESWGTYRTDSFADFTDWKDGEVWTQEQFLSDLESIDWIGVYISHAGAGAGAYGVDDVQLMVPEPEEYLMLAAALVTALLVIRRRTPAPVPALS